jgi:hypothetical protein
MTIILNGDCAILQATVTLADNIARDVKIELHLLVRFEHCSLNTTLATTNIATLVSRKQGIIDLEIKVELAVFQALIRYGILFA